MVVSADGHAALLPWACGEAAHCGVVCVRECSCSLQGRRGSREGIAERECHEAQKSKAFDWEVGGKVTWWGT